MDYIGNSSCFFSRDASSIRWSEFSIVLKSTTTKGGTFTIPRPRCSISALYSAKYGWTTVDYPFLSFYIVGYASHFIGDYLLTGRLLSLVALLVSCVLVGLIVKKLTGGWGPAVFAGVFCLGLFCSRARPATWVRTIRKCSPIHFSFSACGSIWESVPSTLRIAGITSLFVLGGNIKQNLLPAPISVLSDLFTTSLSKAVRFMVFGVLFLALSIVVNMLVGGPFFISHLVASRPYSFEQLRELVLLVLFSPRTAPGNFCLLVDLAASQPAGAGDLLLFFLLAADWRGLCRRRRGSTPTRFSTTSLLCRSLWVLAWIRCGKLQSPV